MSYQTLSGEGRAEIIIKRSRFIGQALPVRSEAEARSAIEQIRAAHRDASHHCFAYKVGEVQRLSDDGEPGGTAGRPIYEVLERQGLSDALVVVTRHFGGILLGAGGLVRAYSQSAAAAVEAAGVARGENAVELRLSLEYSLLGRVQHLLEQRGGLKLSMDFTSEVVLTCRLHSDQADGFAADLAEASAGRVQVERLREVQVGPGLQVL